jgi:hypothetical protein
VNGIRFATVFIFVLIFTCPCSEHLSGFAAAESAARPEAQQAAWQRPPEWLSNKSTSDPRDE